MKPALRLLNPALHTNRRTSNTAAKAPNKQMCTHVLIIALICVLASHRPTVQGSWHLRIVDTLYRPNDSPSRGRLEVYGPQTGNEWGTVCKDKFSDAAAFVMCRGLGYKIPLNNPNPPRKPLWWAGGGGTGLIALKDVECHLTHNNLQDCRFTAWKRSNENHRCKHEEDIWLDCSPWKYNIAGYNLVSQGRLQVLAPSKDPEASDWGTVCGHHFDDNSAFTMCRGLGYKVPLVPNPPIGKPLWRLNGGSQGKIAISNVKCNYNSDNLSSCLYTTDTSGCTHQDDVFIDCSPSVEETPYRCNSVKTTAQEVGGGENEIYSAIMERNCVLRDTSIKFNLDAMNMSINNLNSRNHPTYDAYNDPKRILDIIISEVAFYNSPIILRRGYLALLEFTMTASYLFGSSGLVLCPEEDDSCHFSPGSRIRVLRCRFSFSINGESFDYNYRGVFTFGTLKLVDNSTIEIANNQIETYTVGNSKIMAVFYLMNGIQIEDGGNFTIRNNEIYMHGKDYMTGMYLWFTYRTLIKLTNVTIAGRGSRMVWKDNRVVMAQRFISFLGQISIFKDTLFVRDKGELLLDGNSFATMIVYDPRDGNAITQFLWGRSYGASKAVNDLTESISESHMVINSGGKVTMRNTHIFTKNINPNLTQMWIKRESVFTKITNTSEDYYVSPIRIGWGLRTFPNFNGSFFTTYVSQTLRDLAANEWKMREDP